MAIIWFTVYSLQNAHLFLSASERKHWKANFTSYLWEPLSAFSSSGSFLGSCGISEVEDAHTKKPFLYHHQIHSHNNAAGQRPWVALVTSPECQGIRLGGSVCIQMSALPPAQLSSARAVLGSGTLDLPFLPTTKHTAKTELGVSPGPPAAHCLSIT